MLKIFVVMPLLVGLASCPPSAPRTVLVCPDVKPYSAETQAKAADEIETLQERYPVSASLIGDYLASRDASRACQAKKKELSK
jgi:hypothetical protein